MIQVNIIAAKESFWTVYEKIGSAIITWISYDTSDDMCKVLTNENESDISGQCQRCH